MRVVLLPFAHTPPLFLRTTQAHVNQRIADFYLRTVVSQKRKRSGVLSFQHLTNNDFMQGTGRPFAQSRDARDLVFLAVPLPASEQRRSREELPVSERAKLCVTRLRGLRFARLPRGNIPLFSEGRTPTLRAIGTLLRASAP